MFRSRFTLSGFVVISVLTGAACGGGKAAPIVGPAVAAVQHLAEQVVTGSFIVEPRQFKPFKLTVTNEMINPRLEGTFTASGARNDIEVTLLEDTQFQNWQNRNRFEAQYESGRVTAGKLNVDLPGTGTYYLVFSNRFSIWSNKAVTADLKLQYDKGL